MRLLDGLEQLTGPPRETVLTIGNFDGAHRGHQRIFSLVVHEAQQIGGTPVLVTFLPHPAKVLKPESAPLMISTREQRYKMFADAGIEIAVVIPFTQEFSRTPAEQFVEQILLPRFNPRKIIIGIPFRFGHQRAGDVELLQSLGARLGFHAEGVGEVDIDGQTISSTRIRRALLAGDIREGNRMLGAPFELVGDVVRGARRGASLNFPTANLEAENELVPANGVYVTRLRHGDRLLDSVTNVGTRPTFGTSARGVETHVLDFDGELYGERIGLQFLDRLRDEARFPTPEALMQQIRKDVLQAREILARFPTTL